MQGGNLAYKIYYTRRFKMKQSYIEEYIQLSLKEMKKDLLGTQILVGLFGALTLLGTIDYPHLRNILAISLLVYLGVGWIMSRNMASYQKIYFLYSGIGFVGASVFYFIEMILLLGEMFHLNPVSLLIAYGAGYFFTLATVSGYQIWALRRGHFTKEYKKAHAKMDTFLLSVMSIIPGSMLIVTFLMKCIFGADLFNKGMLAVASSLSFIILFLAIPYFYKYYLIKKYQVRVERVSSDESVGR